MFCQPLPDYFKLFVPDNFRTNEILKIRFAIVYREASTL